MVKKKKEGKGQSFLKGAMVLGSSMIIVRLMGMVYKILLSGMYGGVGTGLFNAAYALYNPLFMLSTAGFPIAISRMVSENMTKKRYKDVKRIHQLSIPMFIVMGLFCFIAMVLGSFIYVKAIKAENTIFALLCLSPTIFFGCLMSIYRGYFEGMRNMVPTAVSEIIEAACKLFLGFGASYLTLQFCMSQYHDSGYVLGIRCNGEAEAHAAAVPLAIGAAITGISLGSLFGFLYLFIRDKRNGDGFTRAELRNAPPPKSDSTIRRVMVRTAIPIGLGAVIMSISDMIDSTLVQTRIYNIMESTPDALLNVYGSRIPDEVYYGGNTHIYLYGCYGMALTLMMLVTAVTQVFGTTALPSVTAAFTSGNKTKLKESMETVLRVTVLVTIPSGIGLSVLAEPLLSLIYNSPSVANEVEIGAKVLTVMGISVIFIIRKCPDNNIVKIRTVFDRIKIPIKNGLPIHISAPDRSVSERYLIIVCTGPFDHKKIYANNRKNNVFDERLIGHDRHQKYTARYKCEQMLAALFKLIHQKKRKEHSDHNGEIINLNNYSFKKTFFFQFFFFLFVGGSVIIDINTGSDSKDRHYGYISNKESSGCVSASHTLDHVFNEFLAHVIESCEEIVESRSYAFCKKVRKPVHREKRCKIGGSEVFFYAGISHERH